MSASDPVILPADDPLPRHGERAALIRKLHSRYPELSQADIARQAGCTPQNVSGVLSAFLDGRSVADLREFQTNKADLFDAIQYRALASVTQDTLDKAGLQQLVTSAAILEDKARLVRGQATSIHVTALLDVAKLMRDGEDRE